MFDFELDEALELMGRLGYMPWKRFFEMRLHRMQRFGGYTLDELALRQTGRTTRIILKGLLIVQRQKTWVYFKGPKFSVSKRMCDLAREHSYTLGFRKDYFRVCDQSYSSHRRESHKGLVADPIVLYDHSCFSLP